MLDDAGEETAARLRADGLDVTYRHLDVTTRRLARRGRATALDVLVNNAGIIHVNPLLEETLDDWNRLLAVNATGTLLGMQAAIPEHARPRRRLDHQRRQHLRRHRFRGLHRLHGLQGGDPGDDQDRGLGARRRRIRVNAICPGGVSTPMNEDEPEGGVVPLTPLGRRAHVSEISGAVASWPATTRASSPAPS